MNEKDIDSLLKQSVKSPSNDFTNNLMKKIDQQVQLKRTRWTLFMLCLACLFIFILSITFSLPKINLWKYSISFSPVIIQIMIISFILYQIYQIREIYQVIIKSEKNNVLSSNGQLAAE